MSGFIYPYIAAQNPAARPFSGVQSNLPSDGAQWIMFREAQGAAILAAVPSKKGTSVALLDPAPLAGRTVDVIAHGMGDQNTLFYAHGVTIAPDMTLNFSTALGPAPDFTPTEISGTVEIDGNPVARTVRAFSYERESYSVDGLIVDLSLSLGHARSDPVTGAYSIALERGYTEPVFVVAFDDYGGPFTPGASVTTGQRIHPTTPNGYVYEITSDGQAPAEEPAWPTDTGNSHTLGTATMQARPFYRPMVHGPITPVTSAP